ncbi:hypothetical protein V8C86DRAFT_3202912 [Haematococcus lacustris]
MPAAGSLNVSASVRKLGPIHPFSCWQELEEQFLFEQPRLHPTRLIAMVKSLVKSLPDRHSSELGPYLRLGDRLLGEVPRMLPRCRPREGATLAWLAAKLRLAGGSSSPWLPEPSQPHPPPSPLPLPLSPSGPPTPPPPLRPAPSALAPGLVHLPAGTPPSGPPPPPALRTAQVRRAPLWPPANVLPPLTPLPGAGQPVALIPPQLAPPAAPPPGPPAPVMPGHAPLLPPLSPRSSQWWRLLLLHCQPQLPSFNSQDMSMLLWALASMATAPLSCLGPGPPLTPGAGRGAGQAQSTTVALLLPPGFLPQLLEVTQQQLEHAGRGAGSQPQQRYPPGAPPGPLPPHRPPPPRAWEWGPQALSNSLWALATLRVRPPPAWLQAYLSASAPQLSRAAPQALANMGWALAVVEAPVAGSPWAAAFWQASALQASASPPRSPGPDALADAALGCLQDCQAQDLANILWALAKLRARPSPEWMTAWLAAVGRRLGGSAPFPAPELSALLVGLAHLGFQPGPASLAPLLEALRGRLHRAGPQVMCNSLWALAKLRVQPGQAWMQEVLGSLALQLEGAGPAELAMCWWALGRLGYRPPGSLVRELQAELRLQAEALRARELVMLLQGYTRLGLVLPKPGLDRLMSLLLRKLSLLWRRARSTRLRPAVLTTCSALSALALMARSTQGRHGLSQHTVVRQLLCRATRQARSQWHRAGPGAAQQQQQGGPRGQPVGPEGAAAQTPSCRPPLPPPAGLAGWGPGDIALVLSSLVALRQLPPARWCQAALTSLQASPPGSWPLKDLAMAAWALARLQRLQRHPRLAPPPLLPLLAGPLTPPLPTPHRPPRCRRPRLPPRWHSPRRPPLASRAWLRALLPHLREGAGQPAALAALPAAQLVSLLQGMARLSATAALTAPPRHPAHALLPPPQPLPPAHLVRGKAGGRQGGWGGAQHPAPLWHALQPVWAVLLVQAERLSVQGQLSGQQRAGLLASVEAARLQPSQDWVQAMSPALQPVLQPAV